MRDVVRQVYVVPGAGAVAVAAWAMITAGGAIVNGHPSYWALYATSTLVGVAAVAVAVTRRHRTTSWWLSIPAAALILVIAVGTWWLRPFEATGVALAALASDEDVAVTASTREILMVPMGERSGVGVVFQPGARVDARAYAHVLRPLAVAGHEVVIVKQPLGIAFLAAGFAPGWVARHATVDRWIAAGHSLGGVVAADNAADHRAITGLVLWASFPAGDISATDDLDVLSVWGTHDGLTTPDRIASSADDLPPAASFAAVDGAIHSHFGDYGPQPGDGRPGVPRDEAQAAIAGATVRFLGR